MKKSEKPTMKILIKLVLVASAYVGMSFYSYAGSEVEALSPELRTLLRKEMVALEDGMQAIIPAYVSGDLEEVSKIAGQMERSYILKQKITESQKHELHKKLPKTFVEKDQQFHQYAGMLKHVTEENHVELIGFYYNKLLESCASCHSEHATHRFPALVRETTKEAHHH